MDRDNFSDKKLALLPNSFWNYSPPFYYEMAFFPWCFMCKRTWTLVFGNFLRVHNAYYNTRVIGLQIASKEIWKRSLYRIFGVIGDVKCTWSDSKEKVHHVQRHSLKISKERWIFCLTAFDCSRLGYSDNDQVSGQIKFENFMNSIHVYLWVQSE